MEIKFHLDEHVHSGVAAGLRAHGIDVTTSRDVGFLGADDVEQLDFSTQENRVLITHDDDFIKLHAQHVNHFGIGYCHQQKYNVGELIQILLLIHACYTADEMQNHLEYL